MKRSRRTLAGRPAPQRLGVRPAGRGHDEHVVARQGPGGQQQEPAQVRVVQRALGDVHDRAAALELGPPPRRPRRTPTGGARIGPTKRTDGGQVRARVLEARHRRLQVGVDHLGLQVDEVAVEARRARLGQAPAGEALDVGQHDVLGGPVHGHVAHPVQRAAAGLERRAEGRRVAAVGGVGHHADAGQRRAVRAGPSARGSAPRNMVSTTMQSAGKPSRIGAQVAVLAGDRPDEDPPQVVLDAPDAALGGRLPLGVGHHQVVGVVLRGEGHERRRRSPPPCPGSAPW